MCQVSGVIALTGWRGETGPATVYVRVLDTSRADAPARRIAEAVRPVARLDAVVRDGLPFSIALESLDPRARYEVDVLVDLDGDGKISAGDYLSTQAYPVLTRGYPDRVDVLVQPVKR